MLSLAFENPELTFFYSFEEKECAYCGKHTRGFRFLSLQCAICLDCNEWKEIFEGNKGGMEKERFVIVQLFAPYLSQASGSKTKSMQVRTKLINYHDNWLTARRQVGSFHNGRCGIEPAKFLVQWSRWTSGRVER